MRRLHQKPHLSDVLEIKLERPEVLDMYRGGVVLWFGHVQRRVVLWFGHVQRTNSEYRGRRPREKKKRRFMRIPDKSPLCQLVLRRTAINYA